MAVDINKIKHELDSKGYPNFQFDQPKNLQFAVQLMLENRETMQRISKALGNKKGEKADNEGLQASPEQLKMQYDLQTMIKILEDEGFVVTRKQVDND